MRAIIETIERCGVIVVPAFAVGRAQHLLYLIGKLRAETRIPACPVFLDSPMAMDATELLFRHAGDHSLTHDECAMMSSVARYAQTADDSKAIDRSSGPMIAERSAVSHTGPAPTTCHTPSARRSTPRSRAITP